MSAPDRGPDRPPQPGHVAPELRREFPGLSLHSLAVEGSSGRSGRAVRERLRGLSNRYSGAQAVNLRQRPIPWAYRVFYRQIGLDPDRDRTPVEGLVLERMAQGGFRSAGLVEDALTIAIVESGVALLAFDADRVRGGLAIRPTGPGERLDGRPGELAPGTLAIADSARPLALLFGARGSGTAVGRSTARTILVAIGVTGVPQIAVEEALWLAAGVIEGS